MSKMGDLSAMIESLIDCGQTLTKTGEALMKFYSGEKDEELPSISPDKADVDAQPTADLTEKEKSEKPRIYSKEVIRGILAAKASEENGRYKSDVKAIVKKYGNGGTLTDIPAEAYPDLVKELEGLSDG